MCGVLCSVQKDSMFPLEGENKGEEERKWPVGIGKGQRNKKGEPWLGGPVGWSLVPSCINTLQV